MTRLDELKAMSDDEISRIVAEQVMGWTYEGFCRIGPVFLDNCGVQHECCGIGGGINSLSFTPSTDYNDAATVRAEIERRGLTRSFVCGLWDQFNQDWSNIEWLYSNATPRETCIAAILAVEVVK